jgi:hypothetical protein
LARFYFKINLARPPRIELGLRVPENLVWNAPADFEESNRAEKRIHPKSGVKSGSFKV